MGSLRVSRWLGLGSLKWLRTPLARAQGSVCCAAAGFGDVLEHRGDEGGPAGLVAGAEAAPGLGVEVLVIQDGSGQWGVGSGAETGTLALGVGEEDVGKAAAEFIRSLLERHVLH